ncbi:MAG: hypothetical protein ACO1OC_11345 [Tuberibacillus sp.]
MYTFFVYFITVVVIGGLLYFLFRRPKRDAQFDQNAQSIDKIAQDRDKNIPEHTKWNN